ncbi:MAG TPA: Rho termination factor N-terminal domain-containing protein, partial [Propionibacteriaceae bacterium]|nr:Rho termination factor N-terminal domain-containing protein [Propionibacteriaceae bacterium]
MTEIAEVTSASPYVEGTGEQSKQPTSDRRNRRGSGLDSLVLAELKQLANSLGIKGTGAMRKSQLIDAIQSAQRNRGESAPGTQAGQDNGHRSIQDSRDAPDVASALDELQRAPREASDEREEAKMLEHPTQPELVPTDQPSNQTPDQRREPVETVDDGKVRAGSATPQVGSDSPQVTDRSSDAQEAPAGRADDGERADEARENRQGDRRDRRGRDQGQTRDNQQRDNQGRDNQGRDWEEEGGGRRSRRRRSRDRQSRRNRGSGGNLERYDEPVIAEDDVLVPARGILDVLDNYAFVRTNGYLPGPEDAYVSLSMVKKLGLR